MLHGKTITFNQIQSLYQTQYINCIYTASLALLTVTYVVNYSFSPCCHVLKKSITLTFTMSLNAYEGLDGVYLLPINAPLPPTPCIPDPRLFVI